MNQKFSLINTVKIIVVIYLSHSLLSSYIDSLKSDWADSYLSRLPKTALIGQPLELADYQLTINSIEKSNFTATTNPYKSIIINFTITNTSGDAISTRKPNFELIDSQGKYYIDPNYGIKIPDQKLGSGASHLCKSVKKRDDEGVESSLKPHELRESTTDSAPRRSHCSLAL
jgi:Domain of unknown function (DUF4352)